MIIIKYAYRLPIHCIGIWFPYRDVVASLLSNKILIYTISPMSINITHFSLNYYERELWLIFFNQFDALCIYITWCVNDINENLLLQFLIQANIFSYQEQRNTTNERLNVKKERFKK